MSALTTFILITFISLTFKCTFLKKINSCNHRNGCGTIETPIHAKFLIMGFFFQCKQLILSLQKSWKFNTYVWAHTLIIEHKI